MLSQNGSDNIGLELIFLAPESRRLILCKLFDKSTVYIRVLQYEKTSESSWKIHIMGKKSNLANVKLFVLKCLWIPLSGNNLKNFCEFKDDLVKDQFIYYFH